MNPKKLRRADLPTGPLAIGLARRRAIMEKLFNVRARGRCECMGECGTSHPLPEVKVSRRCHHAHGDTIMPGKVTLYLSFTPKNGDATDARPDNLVLHCPACRVGYLNQKAGGSNAA